MSKLFSIASWNLEHFSSNRNSLAAIIGFLRGQDADVIGIYELNSRSAYEKLVEEMPSYQFHVALASTPQTQGLVIAAKRHLGIIIQNLGRFFHHFPVTPVFMLKDCTVLFLRKRSVPESMELGLRRDIFRRSLEFKKRHDKEEFEDLYDGIPPPCVFLGSLSAMERNNPLAQSIDSDVELIKLDRKLRQQKMKRLSKNSPFTWWRGPDSSKSDLDQVIASYDLVFHNFSGADIDVRGWPKLNSEREQLEWIRRYSEHCLIYFEIEKWDRSLPH